MADISFDDIRDFCAQKPPEGTSLDYKSDFTEKLDQLICAFANTHGGLIILGVESEKADDTPTWPPGGPPGVVKSDGMELRVQQIAAEAIYPPVPVEVSRPIDIPAKADRVLIVIRIQPSPTAPHAIDRNRRVYERTGNRNHPNELADMGRIKFLLDRRLNIEAARLDGIEREIVRATRRLSSQPSLPLRWVSVSPTLPYAPILTNEDCVRWHSVWRFGSRRQQAPGGSIGTDTRSVSLDNTVNLEYRYASISTSGHIFAAERAFEVLENIKAEKAMAEATKSPTYSDRAWINFDAFATLIRESFDFATRVHTSLGASRHNLLTISVGVRNALDVGIFSADRRVKSGHRFPDDAFRDEVTFYLDREAKDSSTVHEVFDHLIFAFDMNHPW
ncbi:MAG: ATP-binding protein [Tepidisphaeraceae bacterium]